VAEPHRTSSQRGGALTGKDDKTSTFYSITLAVPCVCNLHDDELDYPGLVLEQIIYHYYIIKFNPRLAQYAARCPSPRLPIATLMVTQTQQPFS
jgi:hypothetical protein